MNRRGANMPILKPIIANRNIMCPFDFYGLEDDSLISARFDGRDIKVRIRICPCCERSLTSCSSIIVLCCCAC